MNVKLRKGERRGGDPLIHSQWVYGRKVRPGEGFVSMLG